MATFDSLMTYLRQIHMRDAQFGGKLQPAADAEDLASLTKRVQDRFNYSLPTAYLNILAVADGMDFNGHTLYASKTHPLQGEENLLLQGLVEINEFWQDYAGNHDHHLIVFGETGDDLYLFDKRAQKFHVTDKVSGDVYQDFDTFEDLSQQFFKDALGINEEDA
ncbi:MAG TPA: YrhA family protein [Hymenobacter sp.]